MFFVFVVGLLQAQNSNVYSESSTDTISNSQYRIHDSKFDTLLFSPTSYLVEEDSVTLSKRLAKEKRVLERMNFKPDPNKSLWLALTFPGAGQIYNRKYWKLPIIYGGAVGVAYAITYYGGYYSEYKQGYLDYTDADSQTNSFLNLIPTGYPESNAGSYVKNRMDSYRRYRDIFIVVGVAVYALSVIDAYVDAQLADFDISTDLSMKVRPKLDFEPQTNTPTVGCQMQIYF